MTSARRQQILTVHDALKDLGLEQLHSTVEILVTGGTAKTPRCIISPSVNVLTHTVLQSLPLLARLRRTLQCWEEALDRAEDRKKVDREKREARDEKAQAARQPPVYKQFKRVISSFGDPPQPLARAAPPSRPLSVISNATPPTTPPTSRASTADPTATAKEVKETFDVQPGVRISWIPFSESDLRYHNNAYILVHREGRRPKQLYVSLTTRGEGENKRTGIWVRVGGGWREFEGYLRTFLEQGGRN